MRYWIITPEVPAELGSNTVMDASVHPPIVERLHLEFVVWPESDLVECFPCYAVSVRLAAEIQRSALTGFQVDDLEITADEQLRDVAPERLVPDFRWLRVAGRAQVDDFGINDGNKLVVSDAALAFLTTMRLESCEIEPA